MDKHGKGNMHYQLGTAADYELDAAQSMLMRQRKEDQELKKGYFESVKQDIEEKKDVNDIPVNEAAADGPRRTSIL